MLRPFLSALAAPLALLLASWAATPSAQAARAPQRLVSVSVPAGGLETLLANDLDVVYLHPAEPGAGTRLAEVIASDEELARLRALELPFTLVHEDLARFYAERLARGGPAEAPELGGSLSPAFGAGSMGGYYTWDEVGSVLDQIAAAYPSIVTPRFSLGASLEGRGIWAVKLSDNPLVDEAEPEVRFDAMHHSREPQAMQSTLWTLLWLAENYGVDPRATWIVDHREIWFVPVVNPDGYVYNQSTNPGGGGLWRKNRRNNGGGVFGVDLNRNYAFQWGIDDTGSSPSPSSETYRGPSPASEPEVQVMSTFLSSRQFKTALSTHTFSNLWLAPWGYTSALPANAAQYDEIGALATAVNNYVFGPVATVLYLANGSSVDWEEANTGALAWTPEIGSSADGFWPPQSRIVPLAEENLEGFLATALAAGAWARVEQVDLVDAGDGDGFPEAGEALELVVSVRNSGRAATAGGITLTLASATPGVSVSAPVSNLAALGSFAGADNAPAPLELTLGAGLAAGSSVDWTVTIAWDGYVETTTGSFVVGQPRDFVRDDLEALLGWQAGLPGDTAQTGLWAYGDPVGTFNGSEPSNPEDDASALGVNCFTTGNGSTSAGGDDVDDGFTTLVSPRLDLSGLATARLSYARWFADFTTPDDVFAVSISDDDGASWVPLETVTQTANAWTRVSFDVADHVTLSDRVRLRFVASDDPNNSLCEAAVDDLLVQTYDAQPRFNVYGSSVIGTDIAFQVTGPAGAQYGVFESSGTGFFTFALINGPLLLDPLSLGLLFDGSLPSDGLARSVLGIPNAPSLAGITLYYQALVADGASLSLTNRDEITFE